MYETGKAEVELLAGRPLHDSPNVTQSLFPMSPASASLSTGQLYGGGCQYLLSMREGQTATVPL